MARLQAQTPIAAPEGVRAPKAAAPSSRDLPRVSAAFIATYWFAQFGNWVGLLTPVVITIAIKVSQIATDAEKATQLGLVLTVSAIATAFATPLWGALSDRTTLRIGRRKPWMIGGVLAAGVGLVIMATADSILVLGIGWLLASIAFNANQAVLNAILPDVVPDSQRGRVSGLLGLSGGVAIMAGTFLTQFTSGSAMLMLLVPWFVTVAGVPLLVVVLKDPPADSATLRPYTLKEFFNSFWVNPLKNLDFGWAFLSRFLVILAQSFLTTYQVYYLTDQLRVGSDQIATFVFFSTGITTLISVVVSIGGGWLSDRTGRRKPFVFGAAIVAAGGLVILGTSSSFEHFLLGAAVTSLGVGLYYAVDLALVSAVITSRKDSAKEMGVFQMSNSFPQSIAPAIAPIFLGIGAVAGGNYVAVFVAAAIFSVLGAFAIVPVRGAK